MERPACGVNILVSVSPVLFLCLMFAACIPLLVPARGLGKFIGAREEAGR